MIVMIDGTSLSSRIYHIIEKDFSNDFFIDFFVKKVRESISYLKAKYTLVAFTDYRSSNRQQIIPNYYYAPSYSHVLMALQEQLFCRLSNEGIYVALKTGFESTDIISTVHTKVRNHSDYPVIIVSKDKILLGVLDKWTRLFDPLNRNNETIFETLETFKTKMPFNPELIVDVLMLSGIKKIKDSGIPGIGEKKAIDLVNHYGSLESINLARHQIAGKLGENIRINIDNLTDIKVKLKPEKNVELGFSLSDLRYTHRSPYIQSQN